MNLACHPNLQLWSLLKYLCDIFSPLKLAVIESLEMFEASKQGICHMTIPAALLIMHLAFNVRLLLKQVSFLKEEPDTSLSSKAHLYLLTCPETLYTQYTSTWVMSHMPGIHSYVTSHK